MSDYVLRGTRNLISYCKTLGVNLNTQRPRIAAALNIPIINLENDGRDGGSYVSPKYTEAQAEALGGIIGASVADITTNGGQEVVG